ncbi:MAG TPA: phospholipase D-like domain-containing protein, partial [Burkholderiales bacterium]|nr:phospholipase D-like domain-containing protein [Burkholderiales bacterium]
MLAGCALPSPDDLPARQRAEPAASLVGGNEARLLIDGPSTHDAMFAAMARARDHINLQTYILDDGEAGERLVAVLKDRVAAGVTAQLIYDSIGSIGTPREYFERLREAGVRVCEFNPVTTRVDKVNNRDHRKILVVDGRVAFTGGINISDAYGSSSARARRNGDQEENKKSGWRDTQVRVEGPVVAQFQRLFLDAWALQDCGPYADVHYYPKLEPRGDQKMRVVSSDPGVDRSEMYAALLERIGAARSRVWLTVGYFVPDPHLKRALAEAAQRGVDVRLVLPGFTDFWAPVDAGRSHYAELLAAGVRIFEWHEALMHAKTAVIDSQWSSIGSTNLDWRSFVHNYEADLEVHDAGFAGEMERRFRRDLAAAVEIDARQWRRRP